MSVNAIFDRRSIRKFLQDPVSEENICKIIEAGRVAPSSKNSQPWKCIVLTGTSKAEFLDCMESGIHREERGETMLPDSAFGIPDAKNTLRIMREAPVVIAVVNPKGKSIFDKVDVDERLTEICDSLSIGAFYENMILQAQELGIGSLWVANTCFAYKELMAYLNVKGQLTGTLVLGYANESPSPRPRRSPEKIVEFRR